MAEYTPMESRILTILADGLAHHVGEMATTLEVERSVLRMHVANLRKKMPRGYTVLCEVGQGCHKFYRHIRLLASTND